MRFRTWPVAALGLGGLLLLVVVSVLAASNRAQEIYTQLDQLNTHQRDVETKLRRLRVRRAPVGHLHPRLPARSRARARLRVSRAAGRVPPQQRGDGRRAARARAAAGRTRRAHCAASRPSSTTTGRRSIRSSTGRRREDQPERQLPAARSAAAARGGAGDRVGDRRAEQRQPRDPARRGHAPARRSSAASCTGCSGAASLLGLVVALTAVDPAARPRAPLRERARGGGRSRAADAAALAAARGDAGGRAQEPVARAARSRRPDADRAAHGAGPHRSPASGDRRGRSPASPTARVAGAVAECRQLVDNMVRTVRDLALGLRPSMLDDFGLQPALEWHVRDFGAPLRRAGRARGRRRLRSPARAAPHLRLPRRAGSAHQLRPPRARARASTCRSADSADSLDRHGHRRRRRDSIRRSGPAASACAASRSACASCTAS